MESITPLSIKYSDKTNYKFFFCLGAKTFGIVRPEHQVVYEGRSISIECYSAGPVQWLFKRQKLINDYRRKILNNVLRINNTKSSDMGIYACLGTKPKPDTKKLLKFYATSLLSVGGLLKYIYAKSTSVFLSYAI